MQVTAAEPLPTTHSPAPQIEPSAGSTAEPPPSSPPSPPAVAPAPPSEPRYVPFASLEKGMGVASADGNYSVGVHMLFQTRYEHIEKDGGREDGFKLIMARPALRGVAFRRWIEYFFQWELAGGAATLLDAEVAVQPLPEIGIKVGQFVTPFSREFLVPPGALLFPDFSPSNILIRNGRELGASLVGAFFDKKLEYWAGASNGNGINKTAGNDNAQLEWFGRIAANAIGKPPYTEIPGLTKEEVGLTFGLNASYADVEQTSNALDAKTGAITTTKLGSSPTTKFGFDAWSHCGPFSLQVEGYSRTVQAVGGGPRKVARGGFAQAGFFFVPKTLQLAVRGDLTDTDATHDNVLDKRIDVGVNYYVHANNLKLQARYAWADSPGALTPSVKGTSNTATLQAQLWF